MEGINGAWLVAALAGLLVGAGFLALVLATGVTWLVGRSHTVLEVFAVALGGAAASAAFVLLSLVLAVPQEWAHYRGLELIVLVLGMLLAGIGQYAAPRRSPGAYAPALFCAVAALLFGVGLFFVPRSAPKVLLALISCPLLALASLAIGLLSRFRASIGQPTGAIPPGRCGGWLKLLLVNLVVLVAAFVFLPERGPVVVGGPVIEVVSATRWELLAGVLAVSVLGGLALFVLLPRARSHSPDRSAR